MLGNPRSSRGQALPLEDGINAARLLLPRCRFDETRCACGIEALRHYRCEWVVGQFEAALYDCARRARASRTVFLVTLLRFH